MIAFNLINYLIYILQELFKRNYLTQQVNKKDIANQSGLCWLATFSFKRDKFIVSTSINALFKSHILIT